MHIAHIGAIKIIYGKRDNKATCSRRVKTNSASQLPDGKSSLVQFPKRNSE